MQTCRHWGHVQSLNICGVWCVRPLGICGSVQSARARQTSGLPVKCSLLSTITFQRLAFGAGSTHVQLWVIGFHRANTAEHSAGLRARCPCSRASSPVIHWLTPLFSALMPSALLATFKRTQGAFAFHTAEKPTVNPARLFNQHTV